MSKHKVNNSSRSYKDLQNDINDYRNKRDELNKKTKDYINNLQEIESEINKALKTARDVYKKKRDYWNKKVKALKNKKIEYKRLLESLIEEKKKIQRQARDKDSSKHFISIKQIDRKIENLERIIATENLDITEENDIIDKIRDLEEEKQKQIIDQKNEGYYKLGRKIEIVKINLNKIYEQMNKWSNKSQQNHSKMLELYQKANDLKEEKKSVEEALIENKKSADKYHEKFLNSMKQKKKYERKKGFYKPEYKRGKPKKKKSRYRQSNKEKELLEKMKQDKLATALEKQKAGKKLNLFEARLILEQNKG
ncbi:MAG: hypothetical protein EU539_00035 [Promethearchaeota archaeon]|nr:MAG: hypothetical protein EU539_00035 [Candidatus Lokiarchaeota archaeon]